MTYILQAVTGGFAATVLQMSPNSYSTLQYQGINIASSSMTIFDNAGGQIEISGGDPLDETSAETVQGYSTIYKAVQLPVNVPVAVSTDDNINCTQWGEYITELTAGGNTATVIYTLGDQYNLLTLYPQLFPGVSSQQLTTCTLKNGGRNRLLK